MWSELTLYLFSYVEYEGGEESVVVLFVSFLNLFLERERQRDREWRFGEDEEIKGILL